MSNHINYVCLGGRITKDQLEKIREIVRTELVGELKEGVDPLDVYPQGVHIEHPSDYFSDDQLDGLTDFLEENGISYELKGYATASDSYYRSVWTPEGGLNEYDTDEDYRAVISVETVKRVLATFKEGKTYGPEHIMEAFAEILQRDQGIPDVLFVESAEAA